MNKKLFTQIKNEWRSNLWLVTELLLVSVVLWYIVDYMYVQTSIYNVSIRPRACFSPSYNKVKSQTKHVWLLTLL